MNEKVIEILKSYDEAYYHGESLITDAEYDKLKESAKVSSPGHDYFKTVGAPARGEAWAIVKHSIPMGSIDNIPVDRDNWIESVLKNTKIWWQVHGCPEVLVQHKLDGLSLNEEYVAGQLKQAILRNAGVAGENIYLNAIKFKGSPVAPSVRFTGSVRGEVVILKEDLQTVNTLLREEGSKEYTSCRAAAAGIARRFDGKYSTFLTFIPFHAEGDFDFDTDYLNVACVVSLKCSTFEAIEDAYFKALNARADLPYAVDGLVIKVNSHKLRREIGGDIMRPDWARAMKFPPEENLFTVDEINWYVGKTGKLTPTAHSAAGTQFAGKVVHEVTLHNLDYFRKFDLAKGDKLSVSISMDVIPYAEEVKERLGGAKFKAPARCPECNFVLEDGEYLYCDNVYCPGRVKAKLNAFVKLLDIEGAGPELINKLYAFCNVKDVSDIFRLTVADFLTLEGFAPPSAKKIYDTIQARKEMDLATLVAALGIPGIGRRIIEKIGAESFDYLWMMPAAQLATIEGIGEKTAMAIRKGLKENYATVGKLLAAGVVIKSKKKVAVAKNILAGKSVCFTGDVQEVNPATNNAYTREECIEAVLKYGGESKSGVSKKLDILVLADMTSMSTKARKAKDYGTKLMSAKEFFEMLL